MCFHVSPCMYAMLIMFHPNTTDYIGPVHQRHTVQVDLVIYSKDLYSVTLCYCKNSKLMCRNIVVIGHKMLIHEYIYIHEHICIHE